MQLGDLISVSISEKSLPINMISIIISIITS